MPIRKVPGIRIEEMPAWAGPIVAVPTGVAAFVGSTAVAADGERDLRGVPTRISSPEEYARLFGEGPGGLGAAVALFHANGGQAAWVVSVRTGSGQPTLDELRGGLAALESEPEPAIVLAPQSVGLSADEHYRFAAETIGHCAALGSRMAIVDVHGGDDSAYPTVAESDGLVAAFRDALASLPAEARRYGAAYFPYLRVGERLLPPSAAAAGIWAATDDLSGVWTPPANVLVAGIDDLALNVGDKTAGGWSNDLTGLSVNPLRVFPYRGPLVWGARTLDGHSFEHRFLSPCRTLIMIGQSVKRVLAGYASQPNDGNLWAAFARATSSFLTDLWRSGALVGSNPSDAFSVQCGLGQTMTSDDMVDGILRVTVLLALLHPAEFVTLTIEQRMEQG